MPAIFRRSDDELVQILPSYSSSLLTEMKGKYVIDYPEHLDLNREFTQLDVTQLPAAVKSDIKSIIRQKMIATYPQFEVYNINDLEDSAEIASLFSDDGFPDNLSNSFLNSGYKSGDTPNSLCVLGRSPRQNTIEGAAITLDELSSNNRCLVTLDLDITTTTPDGLGRFDFMLYFKDCLRKYTKDSTSLENTPANATTSNRAGNVEYQTKVGTANFLRVYISGDNGNSFTEIENLSLFSFGQRKTHIKLAFVNHSDWDVNLLTYTLMY